MPVWGACFAVGLIAAIVFLVRASLSPKSADPLWVLLCSIYTSVGTVTAIRQAHCTTLVLLDGVDITAASFTVLVGVQVGFICNLQHCASGIAYCLLYPQPGICALIGG